MEEEPAYMKEASKGTLSLNVFKVLTWVSAVNGLVLVIASFFVLWFSFPLFLALFLSSIIAFCSSEAWAAVEEMQEKLERIISPE